MEFSRIHVRSQIWIDPIMLSPPTHLNGMFDFALTSDASQPHMLFAVGNNIDSHHSFSVINTRDPNRTWISLPPMITPRQNPHVCWCHDQLIAVGGAIAQLAVTNVERFDFGQNKWFALPTLPFIMTTGPEIEHYRLVHNLRESRIVSLDNTTLHLPPMGYFFNPDTDHEWNNLQPSTSIDTDIRNKILSSVIIST
jgi:hypothetical protein